MTQATPKKSDLGVRTASAVVMVAVAGTALWLGGWVWTVFVAAVALGVLWEWWGLVRRFDIGWIGLCFWLFTGLIYVAVGSSTLIGLRGFSIQPALFVIGLVAAIDVGAYFFGRAFGGPKIAPSISPSKTWSGFFGAVVGATAMQIANGYFDPQGRAGLASPLGIVICFVLSAVFAAVAQAGDFFESWMKRKAGVKDSGSLVPGHGGLFDRVDGLLAMLCLFLLMYWPF